jgi:hypothetical protein
LKQEFNIPEPRKKNIHQRRIVDGNGGPSQLEDGDHMEEVIL